jgi:hypothetical protein
MCQLKKYICIVVITISKPQNTKRDKYKMNTGYISCPVGNFFIDQGMTLYLHGPDLASYPVTDHFRP